MNSGLHTRRATLLFSLAFVALFALPSFAPAIARDVVLARGKVWVDKNVPYSQSRYAKIDGTLLPTSTVDPASKGYRTDCSGFVSLALGLVRSDGITPLSLDTATLPGRLKAITRSQLDRGDVVLRPKNPAAGISGHAVIFVRWENAAEHTYLAYEESSSKTGTIAKVRDLDTDVANGFRTMAYTGIEDDFADCQARISGADRYATAASAAQTSYPDVAAAVVIASGENWPDALGGAALAGAVEGPLLLTKSAKLPDVTRAEIRRLKPSRVFVLGGTASVSKAVESNLASLSPTVVRIGGSDRYETAAAIARMALREARKRGRDTDSAFLTTGENFPDALAAAPLSAATMSPILLTRSTALPVATSRALRDIAIHNVEILGGTASVSSKVASDVAAARFRVTRIAGRDRYTTSVLVADRGVQLGLSWQGCGLSSGEVFADALAGGPAQAKARSVMLLTAGSKLPAGVGAEITTHGAAMRYMRVYGGMNTVTQSVRKDVADRLRAAK